MKSSMLKFISCGKLTESSVPGHNLKYQLPSDRRSLLIRDGEALEPFRKVASHHEAVLVPCRGDRVGSGDIYRQPFHRNPDDVLVRGSRRPLRLFNIAQSHSLQIRLTSARIPGRSHSVPRPDELQSSLNGTAGEDCRVDPPGRLTPSLSLQLVEPLV